MKVYFYCSYEHSVKGFFPLCVTKEGVVPCDGNEGEKMPDEVWDFFSYDRFKVLWREFPRPDGGKFFPEPVKSIFGIRGIEGHIGAKKGVVNIAFFAEEKELSAMEKLALSVLDGYDEFTKMLFAFLSIGGDWGYSVDEKRLFSYLEGLKLSDKTQDGSDKGKKAKLVRKITDREGLFSQRDLLRFAVCTDSWKAIAPTMGSKLLWNVCPWNAFTIDKFDDIFKE